jgi:hypothetical protein
MMAGVKRAHLVVATCLLFASTCAKPPREAALRVVVNWGTQVNSRCLTVTVHTPGAPTPVATPAMLLAGRSDLQVGVAQGGFPSKVEVQALGYSDEGCTTRTMPLEQSDVVLAGFIVGGVSEVDLTLRVTTPTCPGGPTAEVCNDGVDNDCNGLIDCADAACDAVQCGAATGALCVSGVCTEAVCDDGLDNDRDGLIDCADRQCDGHACPHGGLCAGGSCVGAKSEAGQCADGVDNDQDGLIDCADPECANAACDDGNPCTQGDTCVGTQCQPGATKRCAQSTAACLEATGVCHPELDAGCVFAPKSAGSSCADGLQCTQGDVCDGDGGCGGTPVSCSAPSNPCLLAATCSEALDGGCDFPVNLGLACNDSDPCTVSDLCLPDAGCAGSRLDCSVPPGECFVGNGCAANQCSFIPRTGACDGGSCQNGNCVAPVTDAGTPDAGTPDAGGVDAGTFVVSNVTTIPATTGSTFVTIGCDLTLVTSPTPSWTGGFGCTAPALPPFVTQTQSGGADLVVFALDGLTVNAGVTLHVQGTAVPVFVVKGDATLNGTLDVGAHDVFLGTAAGPGADGTFCSGGQGSNGTYAGASSGGAGGGAFGTGGAPGGKGADRQTGPNKTGGAGGQGGTASGSSTLTPLRGGCSGGRGGGLGGGGQGLAGGALQLSVYGTLTINGVIAADGYGGQAPILGNNGGGGGGSGGGILLEAGQVVLTATAQVTANGGGGSSGAKAFAGGNAGANGSKTAGTPATGGSSPGCGGTGGQGAARQGGTSSGSAGSCSGEGGGGAGGGGVGRIHLNSVRDCSITTGALVSPLATSALSSCAK